MDGVETFPLILFFAKNPKRKNFNSVQSTEQKEHFAQCDGMDYRNKYPRKTFEYYRV